jgi:hypothetical protein
MEALYAAMKAELDEDGLLAGGGAEVPVAEHWHGLSVPVKAKVKTEIKIDLRKTLVNVEIKSETGWPDSAHAAVVRGAGTTAHDFTGGIADEEGWRRVQPTRGAKRRAVSYAGVDSGNDSADVEWTSAAPRRQRRQKAARVMQVTTGVVGRLVAPEDDVVWARHLAKLKAYKCRHGNCNVPRSWAENKQLGTWVHHQRRGKRLLVRGEPSRGMTVARAAKLEGLGFVWELSAADLSSQNGKACRDDAGWDRWLAKLRRYKCSHGDCNVPQSWAEDPGLGMWIRNQRAHKKALDCGEPSEGMTVARAAKMEALGFVWEILASWEEQLGKLKAYKWSHGDCNVPRGWAEDPGLGMWVHRQRNCKNLDREDPNPRMTAARAAKLEALGFNWALSAAGWEAQLAKLKAYKRRRGDCNVPQRWTKDPALGNWVKKQRHYKKVLDRGEPSKGMTAARVAKLEALGFAWEIPATELSKQKRNTSWDDAGWEAQLVNLEKYTVRHGDCNVPRSWAEDPALGQWVMAQRACKKALDCGDPSPKITVVRVAKLDALGFAWELSAAQLSKQHSKAARDDAGWEAQLARLKAYKRRHGDCNVPRGWAEDPTLGIWVMTQRAGKRKLDRGGPSPKITAARVAKLAALGFAWERR